MKIKDQIYNWLTIGLTQSSERFSEIFYFDKRDNQFFSVLVTDYFMFDDNLDIADNIETNYSKKNLKTLINRIKRIENKDATIISLPRLGNLAPESISQEITSFINLNSINLDSLTIWEIDEDGTIKIDLKNES